MKSENRIIWARIEVRTEFDDTDPVTLALKQFGYEIPAFELFNNLESAIAAEKKTTKAKP